jgi:hypothetical protein
MDRSYVDKTAAVPTDVPPEDRVKGYRFGKSIITGVDADVLKYECEKGSPSPRSEGACESLTSDAAGRGAPAWLHGRRESQPRALHGRYAALVPSRCDWCARSC